jgi:hypothetical protein
MLAFESGLGAELIRTIDKDEKKNLVRQACLGPIELLRYIDKVG